MEDDNYEEFDYVETDYAKSTKRSAKAFADQRRKVRPNRHHRTTRNPVKVLQNRDDVDYEDVSSFQMDDDDYDDPGSSKNSTQIQSRDIQITPGLLKGVRTGKIKEREHALAGDAKKGLESKEDIKGASKALRVTEKDRKTGVGTEKTNPYDGVKDVMFFHIKGARHVQMRLIDPSTSLMNSGDVFVLVTPKYVHQWNGKNCSIMEKARGSEVSSVVQQWKELGCTANTVNVMDEDREKPGAVTKAFWTILGDKGNIQSIESVLDDKEFEKAILDSNKFYEIKCDENDNEDGECYLEVIEKYSGKVPSKKWLDSNKAYVLDFGTEVYSWIGRNCQGATRKKAADIGLEHYDKGYACDTLVHPFNINVKNEHASETLTRPEWCVYGRMAEKTENVAFRRKFFDWPDPVDLKVKTVEAKVHAQLTKEFTDTTSNEMSPISGIELAQPTVEPLMVLDGSFIGRGKGMRDEETLFRFGVTLNELTIWKVATQSFEELPSKRYGVFYSAEAYIIKWNFEIFRTGIRDLKGTKSKQEDAGRSRTAVFFWQGKDCSSSDKGAAALMTIEMDSEEGPQILVQQGKEPPAFFQLFDGRMTVHSGKESDDPQFSASRIYWVRNEVAAEVCLVQVKLSSASLRSRSSFLIVSPEKGIIYVWHGSKSLEHVKERANQAAESFRKKVSELHSKTLELAKLDEGDEITLFWDVLADEEDYISYIEASKPFDFTPRCFSFDSLHGHFQMTELTSTAYSPEYICPFPVLQNDIYDLSQPGLVLFDFKYKMFLWQGWWPASDDETIDSSGPNTRAEKHRFDVNRKLAMQTVKSYAEEVGRNMSRVYIVFAGCEPLEFQNLFPYWNVRPNVKNKQMDEGHKEGEKKRLKKVLAQLEKEEYTLAELKQTPLPEGVDPARLEYFLNKEEFQKLFGVSKEEFPKVPRWKQIDLKKKAGLF